MTRNNEKRYSVINESPVRLGVYDKAIGKAKYAADLSLPDMLVGAFLGCPFAHAKILHIDTSKAERLPGVEAVITAKEAGDIKWGHSPARYDETTFAVDKVRHVGDEVAAVAAVDEQTAKEALELIKVDYEELPAVLDPFEAMAEGAPLVHERYPQNIFIEVHNHFGNIEEGFSRAYHIRTDRFMSSKIDGAMLEPQACLASYDLSGNLTLWTSTQASHYVQRTVAIALQLPIDKVRVIAPTVGGGFGIKASAGSHEMITCLLSMKTGRSVKLVLDREQVFWHGRGRHKYYHEMKIGVSKEGVLLALEHYAVLDGGAYSSFGIATTYYNGTLLGGPYNVPNMKYDGYGVVTNTPACGALRGHGGVSNRACFEQQLDIIAEDLGMDPVELRLKNALPPWSTTCSGFRVSNMNISDVIIAARDKSGWNKKKDKMPTGKGIGVGSSLYLSGAGSPIYRTDIPHSTAVIRIADDGSRVTVFTGSNEIGQGSDTVVAMITAEVLGLRLEDISVVSGDTGLCPVDLGAYSSRQTVMTGNAVKRAAESVRDQILDEVSRKFDIPTEEIELRDGQIFGTERRPEKVAEIRHKYKYDHRGFILEDQDVSLTFKEMNRLIYAEKGPLMGKGTYKPDELQEFKDWKGSAVGPSPAYSTQTCIAEVSVDFGTGQLTVDKITLAHDCGFAINRMSVEGQMEGSMCQGLGEALFETVIFDEKGRVLNATLGEYKIPTAKDVPDLTAIIVESNEPNGPFGAKEVGEGCITPVIPAILNAMYDACGVRIMELPLTSELILKGLKAKEKREVSSYICEPSAPASEVMERAKELTRLREEGLKRE